MNDPLARIAVVGSTGAGKSTLARELASRLGSPHVELDGMFFAPGWEPRPTEDFRHDVDQATRQDRWVLDGNYAPVRDLIWGRAMTIVWLDTPLTTCLTRTFKRCLVRLWNRELLWETNRESFRQSFLSRDSVLLWVLRTHAGRRRETLTDLEKPEHAHLDTVRIASERDRTRWLAELSAL